ncbi:hypothetical protein A3709_18880 [Halioglobus sp. HI00S01]|uniref:hypothetical protein n=1 Tax=Halioglobus sp. HI00S01 TaxID=1822214 RepID=UPI0007C3544E|nr:hypothetical protein [Halioglobus sp. HI00S01]KZX57690.1 hypothetical protein A3709_18880 [Halioglobus sp. HI00S01]
MRKGIQKVTQEQAQQVTGGHPLAYAAYVLISAAAAASLSTFATGVATGASGGGGLNSKRKPSTKQE